MAVVMDRTPRENIVAGGGRWERQNGHVESTVCHVELLASGCQGRYRKEKGWPHSASIMGLHHPAMEGHVTRDADRCMKQLGQPRAVD